MRKARRHAQGYYGGYLGDDEVVAWTTPAVAGGTANLIGSAAFVGALAGWLYAIYVDAPLLPSLIFGGLIGVLIGYTLAEREARQPDGPGAVHLVLVLTDQRLITVRRYPTSRSKPLRIYPLENVSSSMTIPLPVGSYQRLTVSMSDGATFEVITDSDRDLAIEARYQDDDFGVD